MKVACRLSSKIFKLNMINPTTPASWPHQTVCIISIVSLLSNKTNISVSSWQYGHYFICFLFPRLLYLHTPSVLPLIYVYKWYQNTVEKTPVTRDPNPSIIELRLRRVIWVILYWSDLVNYSYIMFDVCLYQCIDCVFLAGSSLIVSIKQFR